MLKKTEDELETIAEEIVNELNADISHDCDELQTIRDRVYDEIVYKLGKDADDEDVDDIDGMVQYVPGYFIFKRGCSDR